MSTAPKGFRFATACAGFRKEGRADLALLVSDVPAVAAGTFTQNRFPAAPVLVAKAMLAERPAARAVVIDLWEKAAPALAANLGKATPEDFAKAIMTTDAFHKISHREVSLPGGVVKLVGMAKGAGMICPNMATMLSVVLCDAQVEASVWQKMLRDAVELTFNRVTVDGDTSTNDTLYGLANGASGVSASDEESLKALSAALTSVLGDRSAGR